MNTEKTQIAIIGAGPGGYQAAFHCADLGMKVTLIDKGETPGGVCLHRGCIPSKALLHTSEIIPHSSEASEFGITFERPSIHVDKLREYKDTVVKTLTSGLAGVCKQKHITYIQGTAFFTDNRTLLISSENAELELGFEYAIIATGSIPFNPFNTGSDLVMDSTGALEIPDIPDRFLVIGGGYIGLELGQVYANLGSSVTVVEMLPRILTGADRDLARFLEQRLENQFADIKLETKVTSMNEKDGRIETVFQNKDGAESTELFDRVLVSVGRRPSAEGLGLENTSVTTDKKGFIIHDQQQRTDAPNIFVIGDIAGQPMLAHKAYYEARVAAEVIAGKSVIYDAKAIPAIVYTDPQIAWAGLTETEAQEQGRKVKVAKFPWKASGRAVAIGRTDGVTKLLIDPESEAVLGAGIAGHGAGDLIAEGVLAVEMGADVTDLALTVHAHPTLAETIWEAAEKFRS